MYSGSPVIPREEQRMEDGCIYRMTRATQLAGQIGMGVTNCRQEQDWIILAMESAVDDAGIQMKVLVK